MEEKKFTFEQAIDEIQKYLLNRLHREREIYLTIQKPPKPNVLAWFDTRDEQLYITDNLAQWSVELLYVLPLHEEVHKVCFGIIEDYVNGYHNLAFRKMFETISGMTTYHDERIGWQFIEKVGDKYIEWLMQKRHILNEIFDIIKQTELPPQEEQEGEEGENGNDNGANGNGANGNGENGNGEEGENGEKSDNSQSENGEKSDNSQSDNGEKSENKARSKMNKALAQNQDNDNSQSDNGEEGEEGENDNSQSETKRDESEYKGQRENVEVKGGKKKFKL